MSLIAVGLEEAGDHLTQTFMETTVEYSPWFSTVHAWFSACKNPECMANFTEGDHAFKISFHKQ